MSNPTQANLGIGTLIPLYDDIGHQTNVAARAKNVTTDADGVTSGDMGVQVEVTTGAPTDIVQSGAIAADQGAVTATFGAGAASWLADISGTFSAGTTCFFEFLTNTTWQPAFGVPVGSTSDVAVSSVVGGASTVYQGNAAGFQQFRVRAHPLTGGDSVTVKIIGSVATDGGFVSKSLPPGGNTVGKFGMQVGGSDVSVNNPVPSSIVHGNLVDAGNSSTTLLTANSVFTGAGTSSLSYSALALEAYSDQASTAGGLQVLQSQDNVNFDLTDSFSVSAATPFNTVVNLVGQYYKVKYTNGGINQATFRLQSIKQAAESVLPRTLTALGNLKVAAQEALPAGAALIGAIMRQAVALYSLASTVSSGATGNSGDLAVGPYTEIGIDINTTVQAGTGPTVQFFWERKGGADGLYYVLWQSAVFTVATNTLSTSIGAGMAYNQSLGMTGRLRWAIGGSASPSYTFSANVYGK